MENYLIKDDPARHWYPSEGWAVFVVDGKHGKKIMEVQKIDELDILKDDDEAVVLAKKKGYYRLDRPGNPYEVVNLRVPQ